MELIAVAALGLAGGIVGGMLGVGGGILFIPALVVFLDESQIRAEATSLMAIVPVAITGAWRLGHHGNVRLRDGLVIGALAPPGVLAGVVLANNVGQRALEVGFAAVLLFVSFRLARRGLGGRRSAG